MLELSRSERGMNKSIKEMKGKEPNIFRAQIVYATAMYVRLYRYMYINTQLWSNFTHKIFVCPALSPCFVVSVD